jgi:hypothetical protein
LKEKADIELPQETVPWNQFYFFYSKKNIERFLGRSSLGVDDSWPITFKERNSLSAEPRRGDRLSRREKRNIKR